MQQDIILDKCLGKVLRFRRHRSIVRDCGVGISLSVAERYDYLRRNPPTRFALFRRDLISGGYEKLSTTG